MKTRPIRRGTPKGSAVYAAAYRSGQTLVDERTGKLHKHAWRQDVKHAEIVLPSKFKDDLALNWARDRHALWNRAETAEHRRNSRVAREYLVVLPAALNLRQGRDLVRAFAVTLADRYGSAVDFALHDAREGRARNRHAHLLATTRKVAVHGFAEKTNAELMGAHLRARGFEGTGRDDFEQTHALWDRHLTKALKLAAMEKIADRYNPRTRAPHLLAFPLADYRQELLARGFDFNAQRREDYANTRLTLTELLAVRERQREIRSRESPGQLLARVRQIEKVRERTMIWFIGQQRALAAQRESQRGDPVANWLALKQKQETQPARRRDRFHHLFEHDWLMLRQRQTVRPEAQQLTTRQLLLPRAELKDTQRQALEEWVASRQRLSAQHSRNDQEYGNENHGYGLEL